MMRRFLTAALWGGFFVSAAQAVWTVEGSPCAPSAAATESIEVRGHILRKFIVSDKGSLAVYETREGHRQGFISPAHSSRTCTAEPLRRLLDIQVR